MASLFVPIANGWMDGRTVGRTTEMASAPYYKLPPLFEEEAKKLRMTQLTHIKVHSIKMIHVFKDKF